MSRTFKKGLYTTAEIAEIVYKKLPGRFKNIDSAKRRVSYARARLGISDINGKKNFQQFSRIDTEKIIKDIVNGQPCRNGKNRKPPRRAKVTGATQLSMFDDSGVFFDERVIDWLEPYTPNSPRTAPVVDDEPLTAEELANRLDYLLDEITDTIHALINTIKED